MLSFPNAKINLGLQILGKRDDGYHALETAFYPIPFRDSLELVPAEQTSLTVHGIPVPGDVSQNLCMKAWQILKRDFAQLPSFHIHLLKNIPMGAGLGGGSADGAFTLKVLNELGRLELDTSALERYALELGSDCPFFINNEPALGSGRGEILSPLNISLKGYHLIVVTPAIHVNTREAFATLRIDDRDHGLVAEAVRLPVSEWRDQLFNDFEGPVFRSHPSLALTREALYNAGAVYASLTGSGSAVYGLFNTVPPELSLAYPYHGFNL